MKLGGYTVRPGRLVWMLTLLGFVLYTYGWGGAGLAWLSMVLGYAASSRDHHRRSRWPRTPA